MRFSLVAADGSLSKLGVTFEETVPSTDPAQPYLAYAEVVSGTVEVVVTDVTDGNEVARVPVPGKLTWGGWVAPPVALSGDLVYVGTDDVMRVVDWRTGDVTETTAVPGGYPDISGGRAVSQVSGSVRVVDVASGQTLLEVSMPKPFGYLQLSPDGRFAGADLGKPSASSFDVYDVDNGGHVSIPGQPYDYGWSPDDQLFAVHGSTLTTCDPSTGTCSDKPLDPAPAAGEVRYGGRTYES